MVIAASSDDGNLPISSSSSSSSNATSHYATGSIGNSLNKAPSRRSRSVSALSRHQSFFHKRDNPLFLSSDSLPECDIKSETALRAAKLNHDALPFGERKLRGSSSAIGQRSLSRVDRGRGRRSMSQHPASQRALSISQQPTSSRPTSQRAMSVAHYETSESEIEQECSLPTNYQNKSNTIGAANRGIRTGMIGSGFNLLSKSSKAPFKRSDGHPTYQSSKGSIPIRRNNVTTLEEPNIADIDTDLVNPGAVELILDIRGEYSRKFEESEQRAKELRADLALEERRGHELSRILKEILPGPKSINFQCLRSVRKADVERKQISKSLTEEAMAYFDECVSISTLDSTDFSAPEESLSFQQDAPSLLDLRQESSEGVSGETCYLCNGGKKAQFSFARRGGDGAVEGEKRHFVKIIETGTPKDGMGCDGNGLGSWDEAQNVLIDRVFFRNGVNSGNMLLCAAQGTFAAFIM